MCKAINFQLPLTFNFISLNQMGWATFSCISYGLNVNSLPLSLSLSPIPPVAFHATIVFLHPINLRSIHFFHKYYYSDVDNALVALHRFASVCMDESACKLS